MSFCPVTNISHTAKTLANAEQQESAWRGYFNKILQNRPATKESTEKFLNNFLDLIKSKNDIIQNAFDHEDIPTDANTLIESMTFGTYKSMDHFLKDSDQDMMDIVLSQVGVRMRWIAASWDDPRTVVRNERYSEAFRHTFQYYTTLHKPVKLFGFIPVGAVLNRVNKKLQFMHDRGAAFRAFGPATRLYRELTGLTNGASSYSFHYRRAVNNLINESAVGDLSKHMILRMSRLLDPADYIKSHSGYNHQEIQDEIGKAIRNELSTDTYGIVDVEKQNAIVKQLFDFQKKFNKLNYGFESLWYQDASGNWLKHTKKEIVENQSNTVSDPDNDWSGPSFVKFMLVMGNRMAKIAMDLPDEERFKVLKEQFGDFEEGTGFQVRNNYFPTTKDKDMFSFALGTTFNRLYSDMDMLHDRDSMYSNSPYDLLAVTNNNMKLMKQFMTSMAEYTVGRALQEKMKNAKSLQRNNPMIYDSLKMFADEMVQDYTSNGTRLSEGMRLWKRTLGAAVGLQAAVILTMSAYKNYLGGLGTMSARENPFSLSSMRKAYLLALEGKGGDQLLAQSIHEKYTVWDTSEKISDVTQKEILANQKQALGTMERLFSTEGWMRNANAVVGGIEYFSDASVNRILGIVPNTALTRGFNQSEGDLHKIAEWMAYHKAHTLMQAAEHNMMLGRIEQQSQKKIREQILEGLQDEIFIKTKEMVGDFSRYTKPFWAWKMLRDADNGWAALGGSLLAASYMFKQVAVVNADVTKALYANAIASAKTGSLGMHGVTTPSVSGQLFLALYELIVLAMEEVEEMPKAYGLIGTSPLHDSYKYIKSMTGIAKVLSNSPVSEQEAKAIIDESKMLLGPLAGGSFRSNDGADLKHIKGFTDFIDQLTMNMDFVGNYSNALYKGLFIDQGENWEFMKSMNKALKTNNPYLNASNDYLKAIRDLAAIGKSVHDGKFKDAEYIAWNHVKNNLYGLGIKYKQTDKNWDDANWLFRFNAANDFYAGNSPYSTEYQDSGYIVKLAKSNLKPGSFGSMKILSTIKRMNEQDA